MKGFCCRQILGFGGGGVVTVADRNANGKGRDVHEPVFENRPGWQRIYIDPPGTGQTPSRPWIKDQDGMLEVLLRVVDEVVGERRFAVLDRADHDLPIQQDNLYRALVADWLDRVEEHPNR